MQDPVPENIEGSKVETHEFIHRIDWGQVALAVAALATLYVVFVRESDGEGR